VWCTHFVGLSVFVAGATTIDQVKFIGQRARVWLCLSMCGWMCVCVCACVYVCVCRLRAFVITRVHVSGFVCIVLCVYECLDAYEWLRM
jgi:hypothetical protein